MLNAYYAGAHCDGYLGYNDSMTLKVKTRLDNLGDTETALDEGLYTDGVLKSVKDQLAAIYAWEGEASNVYATAHETKLNWLSDNPDDAAWDHIYDGDDLTDTDTGNLGVDDEGHDVTLGAGDTSVSEGTTANKPKLKEAAKTLIGTSFHGQSVNRFFRAGKKAEDNPWEQLKNNYPIGSTFHAPVVSLTKFGAFVRILPGVDGLVHISEISNDRVEKVSDALKVGDMVDVKLLDVDFDKKRISLSMKALLNDDAE